MNGQPTAKEKEWLADVVAFANSTSYLQDTYGEHCKEPNFFQIDHILGAKAKRKVNGISQKVGEWAIIPLPIELHDITSNHPLNRTLKPGAFRAVFGSEKMVFFRMVEKMFEEGYQMPFDSDTLQAIVK